MKFLTKQQLFDNAWNGVIAQGQACVTKELNCVYFDEDTGNKCNIGHSIKPEAYNKKIENSLIYSFKSNLILADVAWQSGINLDDNDLVSFAECLQMIHDGIRTFDDKYFVEVFKKDMQKLAKKNKLKVPIAPKYAA